jgi:FkbM family methyltransferase
MLYRDTMHRILKHKVIADKLLKESFVLFDLGARGGLGYPWKLAPRDKLKTYCFEPEKIEFLKLSNFDSTTETLMDFGISNEDGSSDLYITAEPGCSSIIKPNHKILNEFPLSSNFDIRDKFSIKINRLDTFLNLSSIVPDAIKIDVQGLSYQVIEGMGDKLHNFLLIEAECEFRQIYENQSLFHDVSRLLHKNDYILLDLKRYWANGKNLPAHNYSQGQIIFCDAVWVISPSKFFNLVSSGYLSKDKLYKVLYALILYGFYDVALNFIDFEDADLTREEHENLKTIILKSAKRRVFFSIKNRFALNLFEKIAFVLENVSSNLKMDKSLIGWSSDLRRRNFSFIRIFFDKFKQN